MGRGEELVRETEEWTEKGVNRNCGEAQKSGLQGVSGQWYRVV